VVFTHLTSALLLLSVFHCNHFPRVKYVVMGRCFVFDFTSRIWAIYSRQCGATTGQKRPKAKARTDQSI